MYVGIHFSSVFRTAISKVWPTKMLSKRLAGGTDTDQRSHDSILYHLYPTVVVGQQELEVGPGRNAALLVTILVRHRVLDGRGELHVLVLDDLDLVPAVRLRPRIHQPMPRHQDARIAIVRELPLQVLLVQSLPRSAAAPSLRFEVDAYDAADVRDDLAQSGLHVDRRSFGGGELQRGLGCADDLDVDGANVHRHSGLLIKLSEGGNPPNITFAPP